MIILSAKQLYEADAFTIKKQNITSTQLMERAGEQVYNWLAPQLGNHDTPIKIFCGIGNNGGDGLVIGRLLIENGFNVTHYIVNFTEKRSKDFLVNYDRIKNTTNSWPKILKSEDDFPEINSEDIVIDAIFGIGLNRPPSSWVKKLIKYINEKPEIIIIGSGITHKTLPNHVVQDFMSHDLVIDCMTTGAACRTYNVILAEGRDIMAALIAV